MHYLIRKFSPLIILGLLATPKPAQGTNPIPTIKDIGYIALGVVGTLSLQYLHKGLFGSSKIKPVPMSSTSSTSRSQITFVQDSSGEVYLQHSAKNIMLKLNQSLFLEIFSAKRGPYNKGTVKDTYLKPKSNNIMSISNFIKDTSNINKIEVLDE